MIDVLIDEIGEYITNCLQKTRKENIYILENEFQRGVFVAKDEKYHLEVYNVSKKEVSLLQNEDCVMNQRDGRQCEWLLFNNKSLYFIENKAVQNQGGRGNARKDAYKKFDDTFEFYSEAIHKLRDFEMYAIICFPSKAKVPTPSKSNRKQIYYQKFGINLQEQNFIEC